MTNGITAYPLCWPLGWHRTEYVDRKHAKFGKTERSGSFGGSMKRQLSIYDGVNRVLEELSRNGVDRNDIIISTNVETRLDGTPRSDRRAPKDAGVAVYWRDGGTRCMAIDQYLSVADNLAAIAATLEAMRAIERHGGAEIGRRSFDGFKALPIRLARPVDLRHLVLDMTGVAAGQAAPGGVVEHGELPILQLVTK